MNGRACGALDLELTREGQAQAQVLGAFMAEHRPSAIFTSPLLRARQTARPLAEATGLQAYELPKMVEVGFGRWEGLSVEEMEADDPVRYRQWRSTPQHVGPPEGETIDDVAARAQDALQTIIAREPRGVSVAIGHKTFNRVLVSLVGELPLKDYRRSVPQPVGCINVIGWEHGGKPQLRGVGLTGHFA